MPILISFLAFLLFTPAVLAQQIELYAEPTEAETSVVVPIQADSIDQTRDQVYYDDIDTDTRDESSNGDEVGGESEDIGAPSTDPAEVDLLMVPSAEPTDGDPDQPIITGEVYNASDSTTDVEGQIPDVEPTSADDRDLDFTDSEGLGTDGEFVSTSQISPSQVKVILLSPSASDSYDTTEELTAIGIDDDDFGFRVNDKTYTRSGFLKFGDIKGESSDSTGGNVETTWKVEEGEKSKPKEIVVVGSKTTDKATPKLLEAVCGGTNAVCEPQNAVTPDGLTDFAQRTVNSFESVNEVRMDDSSIELVGTQPFKLFGFIPMSLKQTVSVSLEPDTFGKVKVKFPWYSFLGRKTVRPHDLKTDLEQGISTTQFSKWKLMDFDGTQSDPDTGSAGEEIIADETGGSTERPKETITFNFNEVKAQLLDTISKTLVQYNESDLQFLSR